MAHQSLLRSSSEHVRGAIAISAVLASCTAAMAHMSSQKAFSEAQKRGQARRSVPPPVPPPLLLRDVVPRQALNINRSIPFSTAPNKAARPFKMAGNGASFGRAVECLATAIYYEAGAEPLNGQRAVAQVVLNRVRHPAFVPSVCGVIYQGSTRTTGCQFSFTCDGSQRSRPSVPGWTRARAIAAAALAGSVYAHVGYSTHYHADYVVPYWATSLAKKKVIGRHIFYGWPEWWGTAPAFARVHSGVELDPRVLRATAFARSPDSEPVKTDAAQAAPMPDSRAVLMLVIQYLANESSDGLLPRSRECDVHRHFSRYSDHVAVQIYRQLSAADSQFKVKTFPEILMQYSEPPGLTPLRRPSAELIAAIGGRPKLLGFMSSLRDFTKQSNLDAIIRGQLSLDTARGDESSQRLTCDRRFEVERTSGPS